MDPLFEALHLTPESQSVITVITMNEQRWKVIRVGNSRGVRLPASVLARYRISDHVVAELQRGGILLKPVGDGRLSWEGTFRAIAEESKQKGAEFADLEGTAADGLEDLDR